MSEPVDPAELSITVDGGYSVMVFDSESTFVAHGTADYLRALAGSVAIIANGGVSAGCRWADEYGGHHIDLVSTPVDTLNLAVHEFSNPQGTTYAEYFSAQRGQVKVVRHYDVRDFLLRFVTQYWKLRVLEADQFGFMSNWGWVFPQSEFDAIYRQVQGRYGMKLPSPQEIYDGRY